jgi:hypothetical protein
VSGLASSLHAAAAGSTNTTTATIIYASTAFRTHITMIDASSAVRTHTSSNGSNQQQPQQLHHMPASNLGPDNLQPHHC